MMGETMCHVSILKKERKKTGSIYFNISFTTAYSYFFYITLEPRFELILSPQTAFFVLIWPNVEYEPLKYQRKKFFRDAQYLRHMKHSLADLRCVYFYNPI